MKRLVIRRNGETSSRILQRPGAVKLPLCIWWLVSPGPLALTSLLVSHHAFILQFLSFIIPPSGLFVFAHSFLTLLTALSPYSSPFASRCLRPSFRSKPPTCLASQLCTVSALLPSLGSLVAYLPAALLGCSYLGLLSSCSCGLLGVLFAAFQLTWQARSTRLAVHVQIGRFQTQTTNNLLLLCT